MVTVLHIGCGLCRNGGIENYIMNVYRAIDRTKFRFVFCIDESDDNETFEEEIRMLGGDVRYVPRGVSRISRILSKWRALKRIHFDVAHVHLSCGIRSIDGILCKLAQPKAKVIFHSHSNIGIRPLKYTLLIPIFRCLGSILFACSSNAGRFFFGRSVVRSRKFRVAPNAIDSKLFRFNPERRSSVRQLHHIGEDTFLLGFVGRLSPEKNIDYAVKVFEKIRYMEPKSMMLIVGDGPERIRLESLVRAEALTAHVVFSGNRDNVYDYLSAMDALILPSFHEGLGIVLIEAQAAGLPCFASDVVPEETNISPYISYFSIQAPPLNTAEQIMKRIHKDRLPRTDGSSFAVSTGFDVSENSQLMESAYFSLIKRPQKKNAGIITFAREPNYGAALQAYALQRYLKDLGWDAEFVNLGLSAFKNKRIGILGCLREATAKLINQRKSHNFMKFRKAEFKQTRKLGSYQKLVKRELYFDAVVCGSDQIWNPNITHGLQPYFFGCGIGAGACFSYAASCGTADTIKNDLEAFRKLAACCGMISVRERTTCDLLNDNGIAAACVVDPTLLISRETWIGLAEKSEIKKQIENVKYIFVYDLDGTDFFVKRVKDIASQTGLQVVSLRNKSHYGNDRLRFPAAGPYDFLKLLLNAQIVISNSYHALLFSSIFGKEIYAVKHSKYGERMTDYLALFDRSFDGNNCAHVDFSSVDRRKADMAVRGSKAFIHNGLKEDHEKA